MVIMLWLDHDNPEDISLALYEFDPGAYVPKGVDALEQTLVNGNYAVWTTAPHVVAFQVGDNQVSRVTTLVEGHVLIWVEGHITYRLETDLDMIDTVRLAESLR